MKNIIALWYICKIVFLAVAHMHYYTHTQTHTRTQTHTHTHTSACANTSVVEMEEQEDLRHGQFVRWTQNQETLLDLATSTTYMFGYFHKIKMMTRMQTIKLMTTLTVTATVESLPSALSSEPVKHNYIIKSMCNWKAIKISLSIS